MSGWGDGDGTVADETAAEADPLCCCEYVDGDGVRRHVLLCCCDCQAVDEFAERMISGRRVSREHQERVWQAVQERLRIPWCGGARKIPLDILLPVFMLPTFLMLAALGPLWTALSFASLPLVILFLHRHSLRFLPRTRFYLSWTLATWVFLIAVFEVQVPFLDITPEENVSFIIMVSAASLCTLLTWVRARVLKQDATMSGANGFSVQLDSTSSLPVSVMPRTYPCSVCQGNVEMRDHHCIWLDCCVGQNNHGFFLLAVTLFLVCIVYAANLCLTALCRPVVLFNFLYLPRDCSEVYEDVHLSFPFVCSLYACILAILLLVLLAQQLLCISLGVTGSEWRRHHGQGGFFSGLRKAWVAHSSGSRRGIMSNWAAFIGRRFLRTA